MPEYYDEVYGIKTSGAINFAKYVFNLLYPDQFRNFSWTGMNFSVDFYTREDLEEVFDFNYEDSVSNDTLMYIVNITNNNGFLLLDDSLNVIAISDKGNISLSDFLRPLSIEEFNNQGPICDIICAINQHLFRSASDTERRLQFMDHVDSIRFFDFHSIYSVGPYVIPKLSQDKPYNCNCQRIGNGYAKAGCGAIAVTNMFMANKMPAFPDSMGTSWTNITNNWRPEYNYMYDLYDYESIILDMDRELSSLCKIISNVGVGIKTVYGINSSSSVFDSVLNYISLWYNDAVIKKMRDVDDYRTYLLGGKTLIIRGTNYSTSNSVGHSWVLDGISEFEHEVSTYSYDYAHNTNHCLYEEHVRTELVHCNYGWKGFYDGYYRWRVFSTYEGPLVEVGNDAGQGTNSHDYDPNSVRIIVY